MLIAFASLIPDWPTLAPDEEEFKSILYAVFAFSFIFPAWLIFLAGRRRNWARIGLLLLTVAGLAAEIAFPGDWANEPPWSIAVTIIVTAMDIIALYWLFTGPGAAWFRHRGSAVRPGANVP